MERAVVKLGAGRVWQLVVRQERGPDSTVQGAGGLGSLFSSQGATSVLYTAVTAVTRCGPLTRPAWHNTVNWQRDKHERPDGLRVLLYGCANSRALVVGLAGVQQ